MTAWCPNCGHGMPKETETPDGWVLLVDQSWRDGARLPLTPQEAAVLHTVAAIRPRPIQAAALGAQVCKRRIDEVDTAALAKVLVSKIRSKLGADCPILPDDGDGYRWANGA